MGEILLLDVQVIELERSTEVIVSRSELLKIDIGRSSGLDLGKFQIVCSVCLLVKSEVNGSLLERWDCLVYLEGPVDTRDVQISLLELVTLGESLVVPLSVLDSSTLDVFESYILVQRNSQNVRKILVGTIVELQVREVSVLLSLINTCA